MCAARKKSPLENRLRELEKEADIIRQDMKVLSRAMKKPDQLAALPRLKSHRIAPPPRQIPHVAPPAVPSPERPAAAPPGDLFPESPVASPPPRELPTVGETASERPRSHMSRDERFRNYFGHGSFLPARPLKQERRVQRNKAIFVLVVVVVFGFIVYRMFF